MLDTVYNKIREAFPGRDLVPGEGNPRARIMLIGEAPGRFEVEQGRPFVGVAGKNLDKFLQSIAFRREDIYITNAVKFRPTKASARGESNRPPTPEEIAKSRAFLMEEVEAVAPRVIVTLGNVPLKAVLDNMRATVGAFHGRSEMLENGRYLFPLYHPASIIYRKELAAVYEQDLLKLAGFVQALAL